MDPAADEFVAAIAAQDWQRLEQAFCDARAAGIEVMHLSCSGFLPVAATG